MKRLMLVIVLITLCIPGFAAADDSGVEVKSSVSKVTVFTDRALVTREATLQAVGGTKVYTFARLPGWVDDASVRVALLPANAGRIDDVQVKRDYLAKPTDAEFLKAQADVQALTDELATLDDELAVLAVRAQQIENIRAFSMDKLAKDMPTRDIKIESYGSVVDYVTAQLRDIVKQRREIEKKKRALYPELAARQKKLEELRGLTQLEETSVLVTVDGLDKRAILELTYMLPGATWDPAHELRASRASLNSVELVSFAVVNQTSGEDWEDAQLTFSTQSSTESGRIPRLGTWTLNADSDMGKVEQERAASFERAQQAYETQNRMWNAANPNNKGGFIQGVEYDNNLNQMINIQTKNEENFRVLRTRGTSAQFVGMGKPKVRGDGRPVRVRIGQAKLDAAQSIIAVPEQSLNAVIALDMTNSGSQPLVPGAVSLFVDGAFLGMTDLEFVAEGEKFSMFLGVADKVKLTRIIDRKNSSVERKEKTKIKLTYEVTVENLSDESVVVDLTERVPVPEDRAIEVEDVEVTGKKEPDSKGLLNWKLTLKPKEKKTFRISYKIEYPSSLGQEMRARRNSRDYEKKESGYNYAPSAAPEEYDMPSKIINLEDSLQ